MNDCQKRGHRKLITKCAECDQIIDRITFKEPNQWISVEDRVPDYNNVILLAELDSIYLRGGGVFVQLMGNSKKAISALEFTHWMPLPEPPK
jgi:hypothetical protein